MYDFLYDQHHFISETGMKIFEITDQTVRI